MKVPIILSFFCSFMVFQSAHACEYLYPVARRVDEAGNPQLYLIYQKSIHHLELWSWDPKSGYADKALLSSFTPAGLRMLPDGSGFSFIDDGRVRVKIHAKRSPKALDIYEPIYELGIINWIDANNAYFSAKEGDIFAIFHLTMQADVLRLVAEQGIDYMYPQKVGDTLFYIQRSGDAQGNRYIIMLTPYPKLAIEQHDFNDTAQFERQVEALLKNQDKPQHTIYADMSLQRSVLDFGQQAIAFLQMTSETEGFVLGHPKSICMSDHVITFSYYHIYKEGDQWDRKVVCSFAIPADLVMANQKTGAALYESILPLLPRFYNGTVYFVDCSKSSYKTLQLFSVELGTGLVRQRSFDDRPGAHIFVPIALADSLVCGGAITNDKAPSFGMDDEGVLCTLVCISI